MFSQVSSLRHAIMALVTIAILMGLAPYSALGAPTTYDFIIEVGDLGPPLSVFGTVTGRFTGEDTINVPRDALGVPTGAPPVACDGIMVACDGIIEVGVPGAMGENTVIEVTAFAGDPNNGNTIWTILMGVNPPSFTIPPTGADSISDFTEPGIFQFHYVISTNKIIALSVSNASAANPNTGEIFCGAILGISCDQPESIFIVGSDETALFTIISQNVEVVPAAAIPEPSTAVLLSIGLVGMILYAFSRRLRPVAPRRVPVADATR